MPGRCCLLSLLDHQGWVGQQWVATTCLIQALNDINNNLMDEDAGNSNNSDSELSNEEMISNANEETTGSDNKATNNINKEATNDVDKETTNNPNNPPYTHQQLSPTPPDEEDNDYGPVESGPLMNEVCLIGRKGQLLILQVMQQLKHCSQHPHGNIPHHSTQLV